GMDSTITNTIANCPAFTCWKLRRTARDSHPKPKGGPMTDAGGSPPIPRARRAAALVLVAAGIVIAIFPDLFARATGYHVLNDYAIDRTANALERDQIAFLLVSSLKATLALIEGSSVGVGFDLEVGDIVQPAYDYVDFFWRIFLLS